MGQMGVHLGIKCLWWHN